LENLNRNDQQPLLLGLEFKDKIKGVQEPTHDQLIVVSLGLLELRETILIRDLFNLNNQIHLHVLIPLGKDLLDPKEILLN
tara:strand:+ start:60 stop:302 length:243 start_codon:yes stop_codon:yes gene_type:complete